MTTKTKLILGGSVLVLGAAGVAWYLWDQRKPQIAPVAPPGVGNLPRPASANPLPAPAPSASPRPVSVVFDPNKVLRVGSRGNEVWYIQRAMNDIFRVTNVPIVLETQTKIFGSNTKKAVQKIMGTDSTTYKKVKAKKIAVYESKGLRNPYLDDWFN